MNSAHFDTSKEHVRNIGGMCLKLGDETGLASLTATYCSYYFTGYYRTTFSTHDIQPILYQRGLGENWWLYAMRFEQVRKARYIAHAAAPYPWEVLRDGNPNCQHN